MRSLELGVSEFVSATNYSQTLSKSPNSSGRPLQMREVDQVIYRATLIM